MPRLNACGELRVDVFESRKQRVAVTLDVAGPGVGRIVVLRMAEYRRGRAQRVVRDHLIQIGTRKRDVLAFGVGMTAGPKHLDPVGEALSLRKSGLVHASQCARLGLGKIGEPFHKQTVRWEVRE